MTALKQCPCCGGEAVTKEFIAEFRGAVVCGTCGLQIIKRTVDEAIAAWNRRVEPSCEGCKAYPPKLDDPCCRCIRLLKLQDLWEPKESK